MIKGELKGSTYLQKSYVVIFRAKAFVSVILCAIFIYVELLLNSTMTADNDRQQ